NYTTIDTKTGDFVMSGPVTVNDAGLLFESDQLIRHARNGSLTAVGHVVLTLTPADLAVAGRPPPEFAEGFRLLADRLTYDQRTGAFTADNIRIGSHPVFI